MANALDDDYSEFQQVDPDTYGQVLTESLKKAKATHPEWSEAEALQHALETAQEAGRGAGGSMLAPSWLDIPAAGPLLNRIVQKMGSSALTMELANTAAQIQRNMAIQKDVDPREQWWDGLNNIEFT